LGGVHFGTVVPDAHTLLFSSMFLICGYQAVVFAILTKTFAIIERLMPEDPRMDAFFRVATLERGLIVSAISVVIGFALLAISINRWRLAGFGPLDYSPTMKIVVPGVTLVSLGLQTLFSGFFVSIWGMKRK
jgi:hypothetical protein